MHPTPFFALLRHQLRLLAQNRSACLVLLMFAALAAFGQRIEEPQSPVCYILYWQDDPWIQRLKAELPTPHQGLAIEVVPVERFANEDGLIEYPDGAHSIQLRPPTDERDYWVIWFWYSGARAEVLNPVADWFWSATQRHFGDPIPMHVRVSSLHPKLAILDIAGPAVRSFVDDGQWKGLTVWVAIFFCGCYLPAMALAQQRENRTLYSLVTTPVGWAGVCLSTSGFYFALTAIVSLSLAIALGYRAGVGLWATVLLAAAVYVAVGFTLGCWCDGTASTSAGMLVYLALSGGLALIAQSVLGLHGSGASVELQVVQMLQERPTGLTGVPFSLTVWVLCWFLVARLSFGRLKVH
jgi:hypothetical protein